MGTNIGFSNFIGSSKKLDSNIKDIPPIARYSAKGKTNQDVDRATLKDLTGNEHDIELYNFNWNNKSGYGGDGLYYGTNVFSIFKPAFKDVYTITDTKISYKGPLGSYNCEYDSLAYGSFLNCKVNVQFNGSFLKLECNTWWYDINQELQDKQEIVHTFTKGDGIINAHYIVPDQNPGDYNINSKIYFQTDSTEFTITMIPEYVNGLLFDGVDDYGFCNYLKLLGDYTVIAKREWIGPDTSLTNRSFLSKKLKEGSSYYPGEFNIENISSGSTGGIKAVSYGTTTSLYNDDLLKKSIIYQTSNSYNGQLIVKGTNPITGYLITGDYVSYPTKSVTDPFKGVLYDLIIYNKVLTEKEIQSEIKKYKLEDGGGR